MAGTSQFTIGTKASCSDGAVGSREITENLILNELRTDPGHLTVTVENGIVTLEGTPETAELGRAIAARSRHVEGVVAVRDRLRYRPS
jgi:osmotically-inducible protein OsmY